MAKTFMIQKQQKLLDKIKHLDTYSDATELLFLEKSCFLQFWFQQKFQEILFQGFLDKQCKFAVSYAFMALFILICIFQTQACTLAM